MKNILCLFGFHSWRYIPAKERLLNWPHDYTEMVYQRFCRRCPKRQIAREKFEPVWMNERTTRWNY